MPGQFTPVTVMEVECNCDSKMIRSLGFSGSILSAVPPWTWAVAGKLKGC
jgi:hypothetical protein